MRPRAYKKVIYTLSVLGVVYALYKYAGRGSSYRYVQAQVKKTPHDGNPKEDILVQGSTLPVELARKNVGIPSGCHGPYCKEYLSTWDYNRWEKCSQKVANAFKAIEVKQGECRFKNGTGREPVALLSHPGSGNTWIRTLLEKTTGICTGAIYCDVDLRARGFVGEGVMGSSVLVVKSHDSSSPWEGASCGSNDRFCYGSAILLVRNPYDAFVAEWNRQVTEHLLKPQRANHQQGHTNVVPDIYFGEVQCENPFSQSLVVV